VALAVGTLITLKDERAVATWLNAGALSDAADAVSTLVALRELGQSSVGYHSAPPERTAVATVRG